MNRKKSCGCIIVKDGKVLLVGAKDDDDKLFWSFPKGHQEDGETDVETAIRETKEETNLDVKIVDDEPIKTGHLVRNGTIYKEILLFVAEPLSGEIKMQEDEIEKVQWAQIDEAGNFFDSYYTTNKGYNLTQGGQWGSGTQVLTIKQSDEIKNLITKYNPTNTKYHLSCGLHTLVSSFYNIYIMYRFI